MKKITLPAILLTFIASSYHSYGSLTFEEEKIGTSKAVNSSKLTKDFSELPLVASSYNKTVRGIQSELKHLRNGMILLSSGKTSLATESFKEAIEYGSPLGYLYAGVLVDEDATSRDTLI
ncbi:hypothetical protein IM40_07225 [Candidatus Paracaedimonas acanthamoebae]|nr:hypothetical protein IM40_07225 [Candidatus Paracaedimonas acanthamoebae]